MSKSENKKAAGGSSNGNGRLMVEELSLSCDEVQNDRRRFEIELKEGETTIVSWTQLLHDSGLPVDVDHPPPSSPQRRNRLHQDHGLRSKCSNIVLKKETDEHNYCQPKKQRTDVSEVLEGINVVEATNNKKMEHGRVKSITLTSNINEGHSLDNARTELPDLNVPYTVQTASLPTQIKVESDSITHGSMLENAILEMETMVADSRRVHGDIQDVDHPVATKSRLPCELKQKLEIVARLAHSSQGRISDEIILRLTSILGHWLKPRALKRCLRDMVPSDLSACGGDAARFIQFKKEVMEMIELRNPSMATKDVSNSETLGLHAPFKAKYSMDNEMEDKICDFYDIYVQGMNQIKSSEIRKFYIQHFRGLSFRTISSVGPNGAIIHYQPKAKTCVELDPNSMYLSDSGAQYLDGTTDITWTVHFGKPTEHEKRCYTAVAVIKERSCRKRRSCQKKSCPNEKLPKKKLPKQKLLKKNKLPKRKKIAQTEVDIVQRFPQGRLCL